MQLVAEAKTLADALAFVAKAVPARTSIPVLACVRIEVGDGVLKLEATDLALAHQTRVTIENGEPGVAVIPAVRLAGLIAGLPADAAVKLELKEERLRIASGRGRWSLPHLPEQGFPAPLMPDGDAASFVLPADTARLLVKRLRWAISTEDTRYYLNGLNLQQRGGQLVAAATTGHVLAKLALDIVLDIDVERDLNVIVPGRAIDTLQMIARAGDDVNVRVDDAKIEFSNGAFAATSKLIDGTYPDYARVIPEASANRVVVKSNDLLAAVERLKSVAEDPKKGSIVGLYWSEAPLLEACLGEAEENVETLDATVAGTGCVAAQARLLLETIEVIAATGVESVCLDHGSPSAPIIVTVPDDPDYLSLVMPARAPAWSRQREQLQDQLKEKMQCQNV